MKKTLIILIGLFLIPAFVGTGHLVAGETPKWADGHAFSSGDEEYCYPSTVAQWLLGYDEEQSWHLDRFCNGGYAIKRSWWEYKYRWIEKTSTDAGYWMGWYKEEYITQRYDTREQAVEIWLKLKVCE